MTRPIAGMLDALAQWRAARAEALGAFARELRRDELIDDADAALADAIGQRLLGDRVVVAFVAEFSRGKSELINAIFFADAGRRVMPATPGRTTMCPVELRHDAGESPCLRLLPIATRLDGRTVAELRTRPDAWQRIPLDPRDPAALAEAMAAVTRTCRVPRDDAAALGFWDESQPDDNPPLDAEGHCEVPAWRHALIDYPHPLLQRGLVVVDTPGLNAVGAEPELTLGLLPSAHAVVFVLGADTGVTRSDLSMWRDHLAPAGLDAFVVLNKIDTLADPLLPRADVDAQIESQRADTAALLGVAAERVFALSARQALAARIAGDAALARTSRLPPLEQALADELMPRRRELLERGVAAGVERLQQAASRRLAERRREAAEQLLELRALRGKSGAKLRLLTERAQADFAEFEQCATRLAALRAVHLRTQQQMLAPLAAQRLRAELLSMQEALGAGPLKWRARAVFAATMQQLRDALQQAHREAEELRQLLQASFDHLNREFGFAFVLAAAPAPADDDAELDRIEATFDGHLGLGQAWRMAAPGFAERFRRLLQTRLRVVFDSTADRLEAWSRDAQSQIDRQLRERRQGFVKRREALQRGGLAADGLEQRIAEVQAHDEALAAAQARLQRLAARVAGDPPATAAGRPDSAVLALPADSVAADVPQLEPAGTVAAAVL